MKQATLHQLKVFEVVARHGSFTRAAEELFITQPTVSMQIKQLNQSVGLPLLEQIGKRLYLTDAGQELLITCREIFDSLDKFEMAVSDLQGLKKGRLKLAAVTTTKYFIPRMLGPFCKLYPEIDIEFKVTNHEGLLARLKENIDDLYILSKLPENFDISYYPFLENPLVVLAPIDHPLTKEKNIPLQRLAGEPFIMREYGSGTRSLVQELFDEHGLKVQVRLELGSNEAIKQAIAGGLGISVLSRHTLGLEGTTNDVAILDVEGFPIRRQWYVIYPAGKKLSIVANTFYQYLLQEAKHFATNLEETTAIK